MPIVNTSNNSPNNICAGHWNPLSAIDRCNVSPSDAALDWLTEEGSLTEKLSEICNGNYKVEVLSQQMSSPQLSEAKSLNIPEGEIALVREVLLYANEQPGFFGRTVIPESALQGRLAHLRSWGNQSIGTYLFSHPDLRRSTVVVSHRNLHDSGFDSFPWNGESLWGRRTRYELYNAPILISEFFIPDFLASHA